MITTITYTSHWKVIIELQNVGLNTTSQLMIRFRDDYLEIPLAKQVQQTLEISVKLALVNRRIKIPQNQKINMYTTKLMKRKVD